LTSPAVARGKDNAGFDYWGSGADPARMQRLNELINQLPTLRPGKVHIVDLAGWLASTGEDTRLRPDGVHFGGDQSAEVAARWLGPTLLDTFRKDWVERVEREHQQGIDPSAADPTMPPPYTGPKRKVLLVGDSAAAPVADAVTAWGTTTNALDVTRWIAPDCGILPTTERKDHGTRQPTPPGCSSTTLGWLQTAVATKPDIVLIIPSLWDLTDIKLKGDTTFRSFRDKSLWDRAWKEYGTLTGAFLKASKVVVWLNLPDPPWGAPAPGGTAAPALDASRFSRLDDLLSVIAFTSRDSHAVKRVDLRDYVSQWPADRGPLMGNGQLVTPGAAPRFGEWLGNELLTAFDEYSQTHH
jgi:hypothetical protein